MRKKNDGVYMFLAGVIRSLDEVKLRKDSRPKAPSFYSGGYFFEVKQEECRKRIMMAYLASNGNPEPEASTLVSRGSDADGNRRRKPWCDHCEKPWQTRETCWKIHGKPTHMKKSDSYAFQS